MKPGDVPVYVESGAADLGITGTDVLRETGADVLEPLELGFGSCRLVVAAPGGRPTRALPAASPPGSPPSIPGWRRPTSAPRGARWTSSRSNGSVEVAPLLNLSHWIVDLVDTGNTLRANGLVERETILECGAVLVANRASQKLKLEAYLDLMERLERGGTHGRVTGRGQVSTFTAARPMRTAVSMRDPHARCIGLRRSPRCRTRCRDRVRSAGTAGPG